MELCCRITVLLLQSELCILDEFYGVMHDFRWSKPCHCDIRKHDSERPSNEWRIPSVVDRIIHVEIDTVSRV